jgi:hypothetical protein
MAGIWLGCLGLVIHLQLNVAVLGSSIPFWVLLAVVGAPRARDVGISPKALGALGWLFAVLMLGAIVASTALVRADSAYLKSRDAYHAMDSERALASGQTARRLNPSSVKYARSIAQVRAGDVFVAIARGADRAVVMKLYAAAMAEFAHLDAVDPNDYAGWAWRAALQARVGTWGRGTSGGFRRERSARSHARSPAR